MRPSFDMPRSSRDNLGLNEEDQTSSLAKRLMEIFEFEKAEDVIEGINPRYTRRDLLTCIRIPLLATQERPTAGIYVHHGKAHLFLCISTKEICRLELSKS